MRPTTVPSGQLDCPVSPSEHGRASDDRREGIALTFDYTADTAGSGFAVTRLPGSRPAVRRGFRRGWAGWVVGLILAAIRTRRGLTIMSREDGCRLVVYLGA